jgi:hypothetical protein
MLFFYKNQCVEIYEWYCEIVLERKGGMKKGYEKEV